MISKFCREWPVLLDEHGHGRCVCAQAAPLLRGHVLALPRGVARFTHGIAVAVSQILVIVRGAGRLSRSRSRSGGRNASRTAGSRTGC